MLEELLSWAKKPSTKGDLIAGLVVMYLLDSGQGEKGIEALQGKVRALLGAAKDAPKEPVEAK